MPRLTQLDDVLFPVEEHPVFVSVERHSVERRLAVPNKRAIVNAKTHDVLGIVGRAYRLVTNREALDMAAECCRVVFPETKPVEWSVSATDAPATGGHCHIDLVHNSTALDFSILPATERPDVFGPFVRVTNSYNGARALAFDIGFYRKVCRNGMILPDAIIHFEFVHSRTDIRASLQFKVDNERLTKMKTDLGSLVRYLRDCEVSHEDFGPLVRSVLALQAPETVEVDEKTAAEWDRLESSLAEMEDRYTKVLGHNAYAVLNTVTEFASHPPANRCVHRDRNSLQRLAGSWLTTFSKECKTPNFDLSDYLERLGGDRLEIAEQTV